jgi:hypothetical protein
VARCPQRVGPLIVGEQEDQVRPAFRLRENRRGPQIYEQTNSQRQGDSQSISHAECSVVSDRKVVRRRAAIQMLESKHAVRTTASALEDN